MRNVKFLRLEVVIIKIKNKEVFLLMMYVIVMVVSIAFAVVGGFELAMDTDGANVTTSETTSYIIIVQEESFEEETESVTQGRVNETENNVAECTVATEPEYIFFYTNNDVIDIAKLLIKECGGVTSKTEQACVAWCVLNRVDKTGDSIHNILREPNQFAFDETEEIRSDLLELSEDVLHRWNDEKNGVENSGRVLPHEYTYFHGDGVHNYFRNAFRGNYDIWDYSLESPYEN